MGRCGGRSMGYSHVIWPSRLGPLQCFVSTESTLLQSGWLSQRCELFPRLWENPIYLLCLFELFVWAFRRDWAFGSVQLFELFVHFSITLLVWVHAGDSYLVDDADILELWRALLISVAFTLLKEPILGHVRWIVYRMGLSHGQVWVWNYLTLYQLWCYPRL